MLYLQLFYTFFKIGLFGFGGGYAMLSMIQGEVVTRHGWLTSQEFTDMITSLFIQRLHHFILCALLLKKQMRIRLRIFS